MADFPTLQQHTSQVLISPLSIESVGIDVRCNLNTIPAAHAWASTNRAVYVPFVVTQPILINVIFVEIGSASGNIDVGIYDDQKNRLVSAGSTPQAGTNAMQTFDITDTTLRPGVYYMATAADNQTGTIFGSTLANLVWAGSAGILQQASAFPLPDPANWVAATGTEVPQIVLLGRTLV